jgi:hypothetical protein
VAPAVRESAPGLRLAGVAGIVTPRGGDSRAEWGRGKGYLTSPRLRPLARGSACYGAGMAIPIPFDQREALRMLAGSPNGSTESILLTHGFGIETLHDLVRNGLATAETRTVQAGQRIIEVTWLTITDAGRLALDG